MNEWIERIRCTCNRHTEDPFGVRGPEFDAVTAPIETHPKKQNPKEFVNLNQSINFYASIHLSSSFVFNFLGIMLQLGISMYGHVACHCRQCLQSSTLVFCDFGSLFGWLVSRSVGWTLLRRLAVDCGGGSSHLIHCARRNFVSASSTSPGSASIPPRRKNPATKRG